MIKNSIKYVIEKLAKDSVYLTELAEKIQNALTEIGVDLKNCVISIDVDYDDEIITDSAKINNIECVEVCLDNGISVADATAILNKWGKNIVSFCINECIPCAC